MGGQILFNLHSSQKITTPPSRLSLFEYEFPIINVYSVSKRKKIWNGNKVSIVEVGGSKRIIFSSFVKKKPYKLFRLFTQYLKRGKKNKISYIQVFRKLTDVWSNVMQDKDTIFYEIFK